MNLRIGLSHPAKVAAGLVTVIVVIVAAVAGAYLLISRNEARAGAQQRAALTRANADEAAAIKAAVAHADSQWCSVLTLLTSTAVSSPADPGANPSREDSYRLYEDFTQLKDRFICK